MPQASLLPYDLQLCLTPKAMPVAISLFTRFGEALCSWSRLRLSRVQRRSSSNSQWCLKRGQERSSAPKKLRLGEHNQAHTASGDGGLRAATEPSPSSQASAPGSALSYQPLPRTPEREPALHCTLFPKPLDTQRGKRSPNTKQNTHTKKPKIKTQRPP